MAVDEFNARVERIEALSGQLRATEIERDTARTLVEHLSTQLIEAQEAAADLANQNEERENDFRRIHQSIDRLPRKDTSAGPAVQRAFDSLRTRQASDGD